MHVQVQMSDSVLCVVVVKYFFLIYIYIFETGNVGVILT